MSVVETANMQMKRHASAAKTQWLDRRVLSSAYTYPNFHRPAQRNGSPNMLPLYTDIERKRGKVSWASRHQPFLMWSELLASPFVGPIDTKASKSSTVAL